jgi:two-component system response regulator RegX3
MTAKILIVEDETFVQDLLRKVLTKHGYAVSTASDGHEAMEQLEAAAHDLVITDVVMPRVEGFDLLRWIKTRQASTKVIVLTGFARRHSISDFLLYGADDYLSKPFLVAQLVASVERAIGRARDPGPTPARPLAI